ncbi:MAG: hypothetical protein ABJD07_12320 [Gemmatimonadaceae bacterium]
MRSIRSTTALVLAFAVPAIARAQRFEVRPLGHSAYLGGDVSYAVPQGEFAGYVDKAWGINGHVIVPVTRGGIFALRLDLGVMQYGDENQRLAFPGTGRVGLNLNTSNDIFVGQVGPQIMVPDGTFRPYLAGGVGYTHFFTHSSINGVDDNASVFNTTNYQDGVFSTSAAAGIYVPLRAGRTPVSLDISARYHWNGSVSYLRRGDIQDNSDGSITVFPHRSRADFLVWHFGVSVGL